MMVDVRRRLASFSWALGIPCLLLAIYGGARQAFSDEPSGFLPAHLHVYTNLLGLAVNHPVPGFARVALPTINAYTKDDGCYVLVYSRDSQRSAYPAGDGNYVVGQIRVRGRYEGRICVPDGEDNADLRSDGELGRVANRLFPDHRGGVWVGGDTGGWFGVD